MSRHPNTTPLTAEQQSLAEQYLPLARSIARPFKNQWGNGDRCEFESGACMALVEAARSYNPARNVRFSTYARYRIYGEMRRVQRELYKELNHVSFGNLFLSRGMYYKTLQAGSEDYPEPKTLNGAWLRTLPAQEEHDYREMMSHTSVPSSEDRYDREELLNHWLGKLPERQAQACRAVFLDGMPKKDAAEMLGTCPSYLQTLLQGGLQNLRQIADCSRIYD